MKFGYNVVTAVVGSFILGVGVSSVLYAQAKPPAYIFAEVDVKDLDGYAKDFAPKSRSLITEAGGKFIAGGNNKAFSLTGAPPSNRVVLLQFPDTDAIKAFYAKQKQLEADVGGKYASFRAVAIEGVEAQ